MVQTHPHPRRLMAVVLRRRGKTYSEISTIMGGVPKGTLAYWLRDVSVPPKIALRMARSASHKLAYARQRSQIISRERRVAHLLALQARNEPLITLLRQKDVAKVVLATLYLAEGGKTQKGSLSFGNSDAGIISLFLHLLRFCYSVDNAKFRCTVQGRQDQDEEALERLWSRVTGIPRAQFYKFRVDPRSQGKRTLKKEYVGVCRIDYFSAEVFHDLMVLGKLLCRGL